MLRCRATAVLRMPARSASTTEYAHGLPWLAAVRCGRGPAQQRDAALQLVGDRVLAVQADQAQVAVDRTAADVAVQGHGGVADAGQVGEHHRVCPRLALVGGGAYAVERLLRGL